MRWTCSRTVESYFLGSNPKTRKAGKRSLWWLTTTRTPSRWWLTVTVTVSLDMQEETDTPQRFFTTRVRISSVRVRNPDGSLVTSSSWFLFAFSQRENLLGRQWRRQNRRRGTYEVGDMLQFYTLEGLEYEMQFVPNASDEGFVGRMVAPEFSLFAFVFYFLKNEKCKTGSDRTEISGCVGREKERQSRPRGQPNSKPRTLGI